MPARKPNSGARPAIPGKLAPGMRLPRELVAESQRARLGIALVELVDAQGFAHTSLADLTARAHVARAAFYEHFGSMEGCFAAAYDEHLARAAGQLVAAYNSPGMEDGERARAALGALAAFAQVWPAAARVCLGDVLTVAQGTLEAREQELEAAKALLDAALGPDGTHATETPVLLSATLGAIRRALYAHLRERPARELAALVEQLLDWVLLFAHAPLAAATDAGGASEPTEQGASVAVDPSVGAILSGDIDGKEGQATADGPKERILLAMLKLAAGKEGESISLAEVASTAGVSYGTFYKHFETSQDALLGACEAVHDRLIERAQQAYAAALDAPAGAGMFAVGPGLSAGKSNPPTDPDRPTVADPPDSGLAVALDGAPAWAVGIAAALGAYLDAAASDPAATRVMVLGSLSLGRRGLDFLDRRAQALERLLGPGLRAHSGLPSATADMCVGTILELLHEHALQDSVGRLGQLRDQLSYIALAPLLAPHTDAHVEHPLETPHVSATLAAKRTRAGR